MPDQELREALKFFLDPDRDAKVEVIGEKNGLSILISFDPVRREEEPFIQ
jgi:hypothetical protein